MCGDDLKRCGNPNFYSMLSTIPFHISISLLILKNFYFNNIIEMFVKF